MPVKTAKDVFVQLLSEVLQGTQRTTKILQEVSDAAQTPEIKQALEARVFVSEKVHETLEHCFRLIGEQPVKTSGQYYDMFIENFRKNLAEIQQPQARRFFILAKANEVVPFRMAQYEALIAAADISNHYAVAVLLESCLADKLALVQRTRQLIRKVIETKMADKVAAAAAA